MENVVNNIDETIVSEINHEIKLDEIQKVVVGAVIFFNKDVLLLERTPEEFKGGLVELPSGGVDQGETIFEGLIREIKEETDLDAESIDRYVGFFDYTSGSGKKTRQLNFIVSVKKGSVSINPAEHSAYYAIEPGTDTFNHLNISEKTKNIIMGSIAT